MSDYDPQSEDPWADAAPVPSGVVERTPPHDLVAEQSVLGSLMLSARLVPEVLELLTGRDFYEPKHETMFDAIRSLSEAGAPVDAITVNDELTRTGKMREVTQGAAYAHELCSLVPTAGNGVFYAQIVAQAASRRRLIELGEAAVRAGFDGADPAEQVEALRSDLDTVAGDRQVSLETIGSGWDEMQRDQDEPPTFIETPWVEVNSLIGGLEPGSLVIVAARPGSGKTIAGLQLAVKLASLGPVAFSAMEMSKRQLLERLVAFKGQVAMSSLKRHQLSDGERAQMSMVRPEVERMPIFVDDRPGVTVHQVKAHARQVARKGEIAGLVVDYLQLIGSHDKSMRSHEIFGDIARQLKILARELNCPVIVLSQLNRESVTVKGSKTGQRPPTLADLSKSDDISHHADVVLMLQRRLELDGEPGDILDVFLTKVRSGNVGRKALKFEGKYARIVSKPIGIGLF